MAVHEYLQKKKRLIKNQPNQTDLIYISKHSAESLSNNYTRIKDGVTAVINL